MTVGLLTAWVLCAWSSTMVIVVCCPC